MKQLRAIVLQLSCLGLNKIGHCLKRTNVMLWKTVFYQGFFLHNRYILQDINCGPVSRIVIITGLLFPLNCLKWSVTKNITTLNIVTANKKLCGLSISLLVWLEPVTFVQETLAWGVPNYLFHGNWGFGPLKISFYRCPETIMQLIAVQLLGWCLAAGWSGRGGIIALLLCGQERFVVCSLA